MRKLSNKQKKAIKLIEEFIPIQLKKINKLTHYFCPELNIPENSRGLSAEEAFFNFTDRGIIPKSVKDAKRYAQLIWGHKRLALHEKMYREDFSKGLLFMEDFKQESKLLKEFVKEIYEKTIR